MPWIKWCLCFSLIVRFSHYNVLFSIFKLVHLLQFSPPTGCLGSNGFFFSVWLSDSVIMFFYFLQGSSLASIFSANWMSWIICCLFFCLVVRFSHHVVFSIFKVACLLQFSPATGCLGSNGVLFSVWLSDSVIMFFYFLQGSSHVSISDTSILLLK